MIARLVLPLLLSALLLGACGGSDEPSVTTTEEEATPTEQPTGGEEGAQLFGSTCGGCHTLSAADTQGTVGPNLDDAAPSRDEVLSAIESGPGAMPANLLQGPDAETVADFVAENAGGGG
jgi:cytochrome c551